MTGTADLTFPSFSRKWLKRIFQYWTPISVLMIFLSTGFGVLSLYIYTLAIGRVDIFMSTLDSKSALLVWMICVVFIMVLQLCVLMTCSWLFASSISLISRHRRRTRVVGLWLVVPVVVGLTAFVLLVFYFSGRVNTGEALSIVALVIVVTFLGISRIPTLRVLIAAGAPLGARRKIYVPIAVMLVLTVISGSLPLLLILNSYVGQDDEVAVNFVAVFSICTLALSLVPALLFYLLNGDIYRRVFIAGLCILALFMAYLLASRGAMSSITYVVAGKLEIRQMQTTNFILDEQVRLGDIDSLQWHTRLRPDNRVQVEAYQLFTFGDLLLMCPTALRGASLHRLPAYTKLCLITNNSKVSRMPPRLHLANDRSAKDVWAEAVRRMVEWSQVRVHPLPTLQLTR
ncbi:hypothetical protein D3C85_868440 [compost metagenome]